MSGLDKFIASFRVKSVLAGHALTLLPAEEADRMIDEGLALGYLLLGFEGFHVWPSGAIQPSQDLSINAWDYREAQPSEFMQAARRLLKQAHGRADLVFDVVFSTASQNSRITHSSAAPDVLRTYVVRKSGAKISAADRLERARYHRLSDNGHAHAMFMLMWPAVETAGEMQVGSAWCVGSGNEKDRAALE